MTSSSVNRRKLRRAELEDPTATGLDSFEVLEETDQGFEILDDADPLDRVRVRLRTDRAQQLRCVYCHETLMRSEVEKCPACDARVHSECAALLNGCSTLGCTGRAAASSEEASQKVPASGGVGGWVFDLVNSAAFGGVCFVLSLAALRALIPLRESALGPEQSGLVRDSIAVLLGLLVFVLRLRSQRLRRQRA